MSASFSRMADCSKRSPRSSRSCNWLKAAGAELRTRETVRAVEPRARGVRVITDRGAIEAGAAVIAVGPWLNALLPDFPVPLRVTRQVIGWFEPSDAALFASDRFPVFMIETRHGIHYGFPVHGRPGVKVGKHYHHDEAVDPDACERAISAADEATIRAGLAEVLPAANGRMLAAKTCLYSMAPDGDFIIDRMPGAPNIVVASPCSGHGFKFAPAIGEILADLATRGRADTKFRVLPCRVSIEALEHFRKRPASHLMRAEAGVPPGMHQRWKRP